MSKASEASGNSKWVAWAIEGGILLVAVVLILVLRLFVYETAIITSGSMEQTIQVGDRLLIDHRSSQHGRWQRGDIVLFEAPETWGEAEDLTKRVIGLPNETVEMRAGRVFINGRALREDYTVPFRDPAQDAPRDVPSRVLKSDEYWVMGDNRPDSDDSRQNGPVPDSAMRGRALRRVAPLSRQGAIRLPEYGS